MSCWFSYLQNILVIKGSIEEKTFNLQKATERSRADSTVGNIIFFCYQYFESHSLLLQGLTDK